MPGGTQKQQPKAMGLARRRRVHAGGLRGAATIHALRTSSDRAVHGDRRALAWDLLHGDRREHCVDIVVVEHVTDTM